MSKRIRVSERKPDTTREVLVWERGLETPFIGWYHKEEDRWHLDTEYAEVVGDAYLIDNIAQDDVWFWEELPPIPDWSLEY